MKNLIISVVFTLLFGATTLSAQDYAISFETLDRLQKSVPKPVIVFLHAPWCKFCENMKQTTFQNPQIKKTLSEDFYLVSFDGESKEDVTFLGNTFKYKPSGANTGVHELAELLGTKEGTLSYPTVTFLNDQYEILHQNDGFLNAKRLKVALSSVLKLVKD
ncbi:MAG: thioredoxin-related protein [Roseivirga sp.]|jgi:thioredoxin-related protein